MTIEDNVNSLSNYYNKYCCCGATTDKLDNLTSYLGGNINVSAEISSGKPRELFNQVNNLHETETHPLQGSGFVSITLPRN